MRVGEDIRIDAQRKARTDAERFGARGEQVQLGFGLDIEEQDVGLERSVDLPDLLAYAGEDDLRQRSLMRLANALQLAAGDDVEACTLLRQQTQNRQRRVGLDRIADGVRPGS